MEADWVKPGAVVIDVGINTVDDPSAKRGYRMVGDVSKDVRSVASMITPVPGGVGPMTIAMLMQARLAARAPGPAASRLSPRRLLAPALRRTRSAAPSASSSQAEERGPRRHAPTRDLHPPLGFPVLCVQSCAASCAI